MTFTLCGPKPALRICQHRIQDSCQRTPHSRFIQTANLVQTCSSLKPQAVMTSWSSSAHMQSMGSWNPSSRTMRIDCCKYETGVALNLAPVLSFTCHLAREAEVRPCALILPRFTQIAIVSLMTFLQLCLTLAILILEVETSYSLSTLCTTSVLG